MAKKWCPCEDEASTFLGRSFQKYGGGIGDRIQSGAQSLFRRYTGFGDYQLTGNTLIPELATGKLLSIRSDGRMTIIRYREYLGEVVTGPVVGGFNINSYVINPANMLTFPWLSTIACQFDCYKPLGIVFEFKSTATDLSTVASLGSVMMATEYDNTDDPFSSKSEMMNCAYSNETRMNENAAHGIECDPAELARDVYFTRQLGVDTAAPANKDFDVGTFFVATNGGGLPINSSVGSLYVEYEFAFFKEQIQGGVIAKLNPYQVITQPMLAGGGYNGSYTTIAGRSDLISPIIGGGGGTSSYGFSFPKKWSNATFKITTHYYQAATMTTATFGAVLYVGCTATLVPVSSNTIIAANAAAFGASIVPPQTLVLGTDKQISATYIIHLNDALAAPATMFYTGLNATPYLPTNATMGTGNLTVLCELVNQDYWAIQ